jgi:hypothetical protein
MIYGLPPWAQGGEKNHGMLMGVEKNLEISMA